jgi:hypothetical protein
MFLGTFGASFVFFYIASRLSHSFVGQPEFVPASTR